MFILWKNYNFIKNNYDFFLLNNTFKRKELKLLYVVFIMLCFLSIFDVFASSESLDFFDSKITYINGDKAPYYVLLEVNNFDGLETDYQFEILYPKKNLVIGSEQIICSQEICEVKVFLKKAFFEDLEVVVSGKRGSSFQSQNLDFLLEKPELSSTIEVTPEIFLEEYEIPRILGTITLEDQKNTSIILRAFPQKSSGNVSSYSFSCVLECNFSFPLDVQNVQFGKYTLQAYLPDGVIQTQFLLSSNSKAKEIKKNLMPSSLINSSEKSFINFQGERIVLEEGEKINTYLDQVMLLDKDSSDTSSKPFKAVLNSRDIFEKDFEPKLIEKKKGFDDLVPLSFQYQSLIADQKEEVFVSEKLYFDNKKKIIDLDGDVIFEEQKLVPGIYTYEKITRYEDGSEIIEQENFAYGLLSINTKKPLYKESEIMDFLFVVLDKWGFLVSDANITLEVTKPSGDKKILLSVLGDILESEKVGVYDASMVSDELGEYQLYAEVELDSMIVTINSFVNVVESYPYDIIRDVPATIDPWLGPFTNTFEIDAVDSRYDGEYTFREVVSSDFFINETNADEIIIDGDLMYLNWNNITSKISPYYVAQTPLVTPYLYYLGNAWIEYEGTTFYENRSWLFALDPVGQTCTAESPCICGAGCRTGDGSTTMFPGDETIDACTDRDKRYEWVDDISVTSLNGSYFGVGDSVEVCIDVNCDVGYGGDRFSMGYKNGGSGWVDGDVFFQTAGTNQGGACVGIQQYCQTITLDNYVGAHHVRGSVVYQGAASRICDEPTYHDHDDVEFQVLDKLAPSLISWNLDNGTSVGNNLRVIRGSTINSSAEWNLPLQSGTVTHNGDGFVVEYLADFISQNSTLSSFDTSDIATFTSLGPVIVSQTSANDLYFDIRGNSSGSRVFDIIAELELNESILTPNVGYAGINTTMSCQFIDANVLGASYLGLQVDFYQNGLLLGSNFTNSSGWAQYSFQENTVGNYNISCVGQSNLGNYFMMSSQDSALKVLYVRANNTDITIPEISNITISSPIFSIGGVTTISANVTDDVLVDSVQLEVTYPDTTKSYFPMTFLGSDLYSVDFSDTLQDGVYKYIIIATDNSSNPAFSSTKNFEVVGVRSFIGIQSQQNIFKLGDSLNLTDYTKVETISSTIYLEEGDSDFLYYDFDSSAQGWTTGGTQNEWERGVPSTGYNNNCDSGNCYANDLDNNYNSNSDQWLRSPLLDFLGRSNIRATYWRALQLQDGTTTDRAFFEGSNNFGSTWNVYFQDSLIGTGNYELADGTSTYLLPELDGSNESYVRFRLTSNGGTNRDGWTIDSVNISFSPRVDWSNDWNYETSTFGSDVDKLTAIKLGINISSYDSTGSNNAGNPSPDIEVQIFDGTSYLGSFFCNLDDTITYPHYCEIIVKNTPSYLIPWEDSTQRNIRFRAVNMDQGDSISFTDVKREYVTPSIVENNGEGQLTAYLLQQFKNSTGGVIATLNFDPISINPDEAKQLSNYWNYSISGNFQLGNYSAYVALTDASGNVLQNEDDGSFINDSYDFTIQSLIINYLNPDEVLNNTETFLANLTLDTSSYGFGGWCGYSLNGGINVTMNSPSLNYLESLISNYPDGSHTMEFFCNDSDGDVVTSGMRYFNISEQPRISYVAPTPINNSVLLNSTVSISVNINDSSFNSSWVIFDSILYPMSCSLVSGISYSCLENITIKNGLYQYQVCANDSLNNVNCTELRTVTINATLPVLTLLSPLNNSKLFLGESLNITLSSSLPLSSSMYSISLGANVFMNSINSTLWNGSESLSTGFYVIDIFANDTVNNQVTLRHYFYILPDKHIRISKRVFSLSSQNTYGAEYNFVNYGKWTNYSLLELIPPYFSKLGSSLLQDSTQIFPSGRLDAYDVTLLENSSIQIFSNYSMGSSSDNVLDLFSVGAD